MTSLAVSGNIMERARQIFQAHGSLGKQQCIDKMVAAGVKPTTANTYYIALAKTQDIQPIARQAIEVESDVVVKARISQRFAAMEMMSESTFLGLNRALIISGPPGLGKSHGISKKAKQVEGLGKVVTHIQGNVGETGLYRSLYENRHSNHTTVFDDADAIFSNEVSLNLLKAACDSTQERYINWLKEIKMEDDNGTKLPRRFAFDGSIVFITNLDFDALIAKANRLAPHLSALMSRSVYLDLMLKSQRDYLLRIEQVLFDCKMYEEQRINYAAAREIMDFVKANVTKFRECDLNLRLVVKISNWYKANPQNWKTLSSMAFFKV
jgi:hypothetical protein